MQVANYITKLRGLKQQHIAKRADPIAVANYITKLRGLKQPLMPTASPSLKVANYITKLRGLKLIIFYSFYILKKLQIISQNYVV